jgi:hypothetical protein
MKLLFLLLIASLIFGCDSTNPSKEAKLNELQKIFSEVPIYNDFRQIDSNHNIKNDGAVLSNFYQSSASYEDVKAFYYKQLIEKEWVFSKEEIFGNTGRKRFIFTKHDYQVFIEYSGAGFDYAISIGWKMGQ